MDRVRTYDHNGNDITCMKVFDALEYPCRACDNKDCPDRETYESEEATMWVSKSVHGTVNVCVQNCKGEVKQLLRRFDVWKSTGRVEYDENKPKALKIWFECPLEFLDFIGSSMGRACFERMGVKKFIFI